MCKLAKRLWLPLAVFFLVCNPDLSAKTAGKKSDDEFGNVKKGKVTQEYQTYKGQAKLKKTNQEQPQTPPAIPHLGALEKKEAEPGEIMTVYGKRLIIEENGRKQINWKQFYLVQGKTEKLVITNAGRNRGDEQSVFFWVPMDAAGPYTFKILAKSGAILTWENLSLSVGKKAPPIPHLGALEKKEAEPGEIMTVYGKHFITKENGRKQINWKQFYLVQGKTEKLVITNAGRNRGDEQSVFFMIPKDASGPYTFKILAKSGAVLEWENLPFTVAKKTPPIPVITGVSKTKVEVGEPMFLYGKNLIGQDASGFMSMNFKKMFFVEGRVEDRVMAITSGRRRGSDQSINFSAPKKAGSYSIKIIAKTGEVITWNNPLVAVKDTAAEKKKAEEELAKKKAEEELAKKKAEEELAKKKAEEILARKKAFEEEAKRKEQERLAKKKAEEELAKKKAEEELARKQKEERERQLAAERARQQKQLEEEQRRQREREELARRQREESGSRQYCNPDVPRYSQPGCVELPQQEGPPPTQGQPCNPNVPRYSQPGCVE